MNENVLYECPAGEKEYDPVVDSEEDAAAEMKEEDAENEEVLAVLEKAKKEVEDVEAIFQEKKQAVVAKTKEELKVVDNEWAKKKQEFDDMLLDQ